jgi:hypothetical protein
MGSWRTGGWTLALSAAVLLLCVASAPAATTRVVSPSSIRTMDPCDTVTPCRLDFAMANTVSTDDVSLLPGDYYQVGTTPWAGLPALQSNESIHGTPGQSVPVIHGLVGATSSFMELNGAAARDLAVDMEITGMGLTVTGLRLLNGATAERVRVHGTSAATNSLLSPCLIENTGTLLDSACIGDGTSSVWALSQGSSGDSTGTVRNVTAISTATNGVGMRNGTATGTAVLTATNVIARGTEADTDLTANNAGATARFVIDHSNWRTTQNTGPGTHQVQQGLGNQTGPTAPAPLFVNQAAGDYRQAPGSPTIDAGATSAANGPFDFGGDPRLIGAATDIGADEFWPPPLATTGSASGVGERTATLNGTVNPMGDSATVRFEYGTTTAYGSTAAAPNLPASQNASPVTAALAGLSPDTTYHYRLVATTGRGGTAAGADQTFRTLPSPTAQPSTTAQPDAAAVISGVRIGRRWRLGSLLPRATRRRRPPVGTTIAFTLSEPARVTLEFSQPRTGRRVAGRCRRLTPANRRRPRCTLANVRGRLTINAHTGRNRVRFQGRLTRRKTLKLGAYLLTVRAIDGGGNRSTPRRVRFTIVR